VVTLIAQGRGGGATTMKERGFTPGSSSGGCDWGRSRVAAAEERHGCDGLAVWNEEVKSEF